MTLMGFFILLVIAFVCGSIAQALAGGGRGGCLVSIALGFIGAPDRQLDRQATRLAGDPIGRYWRRRTLPDRLVDHGRRLFSAVLGIFTSRRRM